MTHYDVIIIGSGAGGGTLARKLAPSGKRILLLERGGYLPREKDNWDPSEVFVQSRYVSKDTWFDHDGKPFQPGVHYYVGGATKVFGAALFRLRERDFHAHRTADGMTPDWPLGYDAFEPYYTEAEQLYQVHGIHGEDPTDPPASAPYPWPPVSHEPRIAQLAQDLRRAGYHPSHAPTGILLDEADRPHSRCIRCDTCDGFPCLVHAKSDAEVIAVRPALQHPNVTLRTHAEVIRLDTSASGRDVSRVVVEREGARDEYTADIVVVSCGAANSARLLLMSASDHHPRGLALLATSGAEIQRAALPLTSGSTVTTVSQSAQIRQAGGMTFDASGRLWVTSLPQGSGTTANVFAPPLTSTSTPALVFGIPSVGYIFQIQFDHQDNLWASDHSNDVVYMFAPPFTSSRTLTPSVTLPLTGLQYPFDIAVDASGNVYVAIGASVGTNSIAVFRAPITSASVPAFFLNGLTDPGALGFDAQGNLYASSNPTSSRGSIVRYNSNHLTSGATPDIVNSTGLSTGTFAASFAFDAAGNLYVADCGLPGTFGVRSYPTGSSSFSATLAPSATYTNSSINAAACVWGIAIH